MKGRKPFRIVVAEPYAPDAIARLEAVGDVTVLKDSAPDTLIGALPEADALLVRTKTHVTARIIKAAPRLRVIGRASRTLDHIDLRAAGSRDISVVYSPLAAVASTAEFALGLMMALHRQIPFLDRLLRDGKFESIRQPAGHELGRRTLGLLGADPIASALCRIVSAAFGSRVLQYDPLGGGVGGADRVDLDTLLAESDILSVHLRLTPETRGFLSGDRIAAMKASALLVNVTQGTTVDTVALAEALRKRHLAGAALDVFETEPLPQDHPLRRAPNCILTPHVSGLTLDAAEGRFDVADDVVRVLRGEAPMHPADMPAKQ